MPRKKKKRTKRITGESYNPQVELLELFRKKAPEIFSESKVDCKKLKETLGEEVETGEERYGLNWAGKNDCFNEIQKTTTATLKPDRKESVNFDKTGNIFIEGENLEVLRVLQKSYYGKIKMIYIDPPYNTGHDFVYNDKFSETKEEYLENSGAVDEQGNLASDSALRKNTKDSGHYHSNWLNMMYPRLFLARNLLKQDGVIFVSIDDNEVHNLRMIMDEVFGESNFVSQVTWRRKKESSNDSKGFSVKGEYVLIYSKSSEAKIHFLPLSEEYIRKSYQKPNKEYPLGKWRPVTIAVSKGHQGKGYSYPIKTPKGKVIEKTWLYPKSHFKKLLDDGRIYFGKKGDSIPQRIIYENEGGGVPPSNIWYEVATNKEGKKEIVDLFGFAVFDTVKPVQLLKRMLVLVTGKKEGDMTLDFFTGSGTTANAVMSLNAEDGGNRKCISVQIAEKTDPKSEAYEAGYKTISDIAKERIRQAGKQILKERKGKLNFDKNKLDVGFKSLKLEPSNFKSWRRDIKTKKDLLEQMDIFVNNVKSNAVQENILYELMLKTGLDLNEATVKKQSKDKKAYYILGGVQIVCLEDELSEALVSEIIAAKPEKFVCLDKAFKNNDQLKTNTTLKLEEAGVEFRVV